MQENTVLTCVYCGHKFPEGTQSAKHKLKLHDPRDIISDEDIERVHANAHFGSMNKRTVVDQAVLKCASGYRQGSTSTAIIKEHGLVTEDYKLTRKGKKYLWAVYSNPPSDSV